MVVAVRSPARTRSPAGGRSPARTPARLPGPRALPAPRARPTPHTPHPTHTTPTPQPATQKPRIPRPPLRSRRLASRPPSLDSPPRPRHEARGRDRRRLVRHRAWRCCSPAGGCARRSRRAPSRAGAAAGRRPREPRLPAAASSCRGSCGSSTRAAGLARADYVFLGVPSTGLDEVIDGLERAGLAGRARPSSRSPRASSRPTAHRRRRCCGERFGAHRVACIGGPAHAREMVSDGAGLVAASTRGVARARRSRGVFTPRRRRVRGVQRSDRRRARRRRQERRGARVRARPRRRA